MNSNGVTVKLLKRPSFFFVPFGFLSPVTPGMAARQDVGNRAVPPADSNEEGRVCASHTPGLVSSVPGSRFEGRQENSGPRTTAVHGLTSRLSPVYALDLLFLFRVPADPAGEAIDVTRRRG